MRSQSGQSGFGHRSPLAFQSLLFAEEMTESNAPSLTHAAVAPLVDLVPILCAHVLGILALRG